MGRYYQGDISGKFWVAVQSSFDPSYFGVEPTQEYEFYGCLCCATDYINNCSTEEEKNFLFCKYCYKTLEEHIEQTKDDRYYEGIETQKTWRADEAVLYSFSQNNLKKVTQAVKRLEKKYGKYMNDFSIVDDDQGEIEYEFSSSISLGNDSEGVARLCLGKQILYCLEKNGTCTFTAEI